MRSKHILLLLFISYVTLTCTKREGLRKDRNRNRIRNRNRNRKGSMEQVHWRAMEAGGADVEEGCRLEVLCQNPSGGVPKLMTLPREGPRGPPGKAGQPGRPGKGGMPGLSAESAGLHKSRQSQLAFFVGLRANKGPVPEDEDLVFDNVVTNVGRAFDQITGHFLVPFNGSYKFTVVVAAQGRQRAAVHLVVNGGMVVTIWAESIPYWASATNSAILNLRAGDQVWLVLLSRAAYIHGYMYSTFSGSLLFTD